MSDKIETLYEMKRAGYKLLGNAKCKGCGADIEWWLTCNRKRIPFNPTGDNDAQRVTPHWATCPKADSFRSGQNGAAAKPAGNPTRAESESTSAAANSTQARQKLVETLRRAGDARVVVAVYDDGATASWRNGLSGEDLRHELISEANSIRNHIEKDGAQ